jgi:hypothetical protein
MTTLLTGMADPDKRLTSESMPTSFSPNMSRRTLEAKQAAMTRSQWQNFLEVYRPVEQELLKKATQTDFTKEGDEAGRDAAAGVQASQGMLARNLSRTGLTLSPEEAEAVRRRANLETGRSVGRSENTTRRTLSQSRTNLLAGLVGVGHQVATGAVGGINSASNNAASREMAMNASASQARQTNVAAGTALLGALIMAV